MGHCNHSLPSSVYHSPHIEHSLSLLLDFSWPQTRSLAFLYHRVWKTFGLPLSWKILYCSLLCHWSVEQICGLKVFRDGWCLMNTFRLNYFIRFWQVHSNNRWHKFHGRVRKLFEWIDQNLAWFYFSENDVFDGSAYVIHWDLAMVSLIVEPWLIQEHCSC